MKGLLKLRLMLANDVINILQLDKLNYMNNTCRGLVCSVCDKRIAEKLYNNKVLCNKCFEDIKKLQN